MGPRSCERGKGVVTIEELEELKASMGPRSCERGKSGGLLWGAMKAY